MVVIKRVEVRLLPRVIYKLRVMYKLLTFLRIPNDAKGVLLRYVVALITKDRRSQILAKLRFASMQYRIQTPVLYKATRRQINDIPLSSAKPKLAVFARRRAAHFLDPVLEAVKGSFDIYRYYEEPQLVEDASKFSLIWLEWGSSGHVLNMLGNKARVWVRIHDWELTNHEILRSVEWNKAERIIFINPDTMDDFREKVQSDNRKHLFIPNGINEHQFPYQERQGFNREILMLSEYFQDRKEYPRALRVLGGIRDYGFHLTIRAEPRGDYKFCLKCRGSLNADFAEPIIDKLRLTAKDDLIPEYAKADIVMSTSNHEGFHYVIAEGALCGCYPVVIDWEWGRAKEFWGGYVHEDVATMSQHLIEWSALSNHAKQRESKEAREYVIRNFGLEATKKRILQAYND